MERICSSLLWILTVFLHKGQKFVRSGAIESIMYERRGVSAASAHGALAPPTEPQRPSLSTSDPIFPIGLRETEVGHRGAFMWLQVVSMEFSSWFSAMTRQYTYVVATPLTWTPTSQP